VAIIATLRGLDDLNEAEKKKKDALRPQTHLPAVID